MSSCLFWQLVDVYTQRIINIIKPKVTLGRSRDADISCTSVAASRAHAEFILSNDGRLSIIDLKVSLGQYQL